MLEAMQWHRHPCGTVLRPDITTSQFFDHSQNQTALLFWVELITTFKDHCSQHVHELSGHSHDIAPHSAPLPDFIECQMLSRSFSSGLLSSFISGKMQFGESNFCFFASIFSCVAAFDWLENASANWKRPYNQSMAQKSHFPHWAKNSTSLLQS